MKTVISGTATQTATDANPIDAVSNAALPLLGVGANRRPTEHAQPFDHPPDDFEHPPMTQTETDTETDTNDSTETDSGLYLDSIDYVEPLLSFDASRYTTKTELTASAKELADEHAVAQFGTPTSNDDTTPPTACPIIAHSYRSIGLNGGRQGPALVATSHLWLANTGQYVVKTTTSLERLADFTHIDTPAGFERLLIIRSEDPSHDELWIARFDDFDKAIERLIDVAYHVRDARAIPTEEKFAYAWRYEEPFLH